ncbi:MAG: hypothetical protein DHS20C10_11030 [marine bacterium B5-7]|nr:MAG: hypothetical protein DHS20C10_11030 [marine bacterium B5-7]
MPNSKDVIFGAKADRALAAIARSVAAVCEQLAKTDDTHSKFYRYRPDEATRDTGYWDAAKKAYTHIVDSARRIDTRQLPFSVIRVKHQYYAILNGKLDASVKKMAGSFSSFKPLRRIVLTRNQGTGAVSVAWAKKTEKQLGMKVVKSRQKIRAFLEARYPVQRARSPSKFSSRVESYKTSAVWQVKHEAKVWGDSTVTLFQTFRENVSSHSSPKKRCMIVPRQPGVELTDWIDHKKALSAEQFFAVASSLLKATDALHQRGFIHRDIKPPNMCVNLDPNTGEIAVNLLDYGSALDFKDFRIGSQFRGMVGTLGYIPPEYIRVVHSSVSTIPGYSFRDDLSRRGINIFERDCQSDAIPEYSEKTDIYAIGATLRELKVACCSRLDAASRGDIDGLIAGLTADHPVNRMSVDEALSYIESPNTFYKVFVQPSPVRPVRVAVEKKPPVECYTFGTQDAANFDDIFGGVYTPKRPKRPRDESAGPDFESNSKRPRPDSWF